MLSASEGTPVVDAGTTRYVWLTEQGTASAPLNGRVLDGGGVATVWSVHLGPGPVSFSDPASPSAHASFKAPGTYVLKLSAAGSASGTLRDSFVVASVYPANQTFGYDRATLDNVFSVNPPLALAFDGVDYNKLKPPPPVGVHPRVLFYPEDLPSIKAAIRVSVAHANALPGTAQGQLVMTGIRDMLVSRLTGGVDSKGKVWGKGNRTTTAGLAIGPVFDDLAAGNITSFEKLPVDPYAGSGNLGYTVVSAMMYEGPAPALKAAAALATVAQKVVRDLRAADTVYYRQVVMGLCYYEFFGQAYDLLHPFMSEDQRTLARSALALASGPGMWSIGMDGLRPTTGTSNWVPMHTTQVDLCSHPSLFTQMVLRLRHLLSH
eukprot:gene2249-3121_t